MFPAPIHLVDVCIHCEHPFSAVSAEALRLARLEHVRFICTTRDQQVDEHFTLPRMEALLQA